MRRTPAALSFVLLCAFCSKAQTNPPQTNPPQTNPPPLFRCKDQSHLIKLSLNNSGETAEGSVCAEITVNAFRYSAEFGKTFSYSAGPSLSSIFPSSFSPGGGLGGEVASLEAQFLVYESAADQISKQLQLIQSKNRTATSNLDKYLSNLKTFVTQSDDLLSSGGPAAVMAVVSGADFTKQMDDA